MFTNRRSQSLGTKRKKQPWPKEKPFKILSLDGGGIRGLYTAKLLLECEQELCRGRALSSYFDMFAGTSTGGIIILGLARGLSMQEIYDFYREDGKEIFRIGKIRKCLKKLFDCITPRLDYKKLEEALKRNFGDFNLGSSPTRLVIPAFSMYKTEICVFKTDHHADFKNDHRSRMWEVARATSAAPTYFKGHEHRESGAIFLDGGVWANNPVMIAVIDALTCYDLKPEQIEVLSIGTGNPPFVLERSNIFRGLISWRKIIECAMYLSTDNATAQAKLLLGPEQCLRLEPRGKDAEIKLDDYNQAIKKLPSLAEEHFQSNKGHLESFFLATCTERERHYSHSG